MPHPPNEDPTVITSDELPKDRIEILIIRHGKYCRLRRTRQDKLILTK